MRIFRLCLSLCLLGAQAGAQQGDTATLFQTVEIRHKIAAFDTPAVLEAVTVTAEKREALLQNVPLSVTVLGAKAIDEYRLWNISGLTAIVPTLYAADPGDNRTVTSIRGITTTSYDPAVAVYIDGVNQFGLDTYISELLETERIEILRGPQSTLYGRNAMGGVINIITRQPGAKRAAFAEANVGNYGLQRYRAGFRTPLTKRLLLGAAVMYSKSGGYYTNTFDGSRYDRQRNLSGNYFLKYLSPSGRWTIALNAKHQGVKNNGAFPLVYGIEEAIASPFILSQNATTEMRDATANASLSLRFKGRRFVLTSETGYQSNRRVYADIIDGDFSPASGIGIFNNYGGAWNRSQVLTQELRLSAPADRGARAIDWVAGTYLFHQRSPVKQATVFGADALQFGAPDSLFRIVNASTGTNSGIAFFGQVTVPVTSRLRLTGGLRYDYQRSRLSLRSDYVSDNGGPAFPVQEDTSGSGTYGAFSPRAGLLYAFSVNHSGYLNFSRGYRTGGLTQIGSDPSQPALSPFNPEYSNNFEIGVKNMLFEDRVRLNLAAFYIHVTDLQVPSLVLPAAITITRNTGMLESRGVEAEVSAVVLKRGSIQYGFGYTDARFRRLRMAENGAEVDYSGNRQLFTPDVTSALALQYAWRLKTRRSLSLVARGEWMYIGRKYFNAANTLVQQPYQLLNARLSLRAQRWELAAWARNLGDARYVDYAYDFGAAHLGDPRTYGLTLQVRVE